MVSPKPKALITLAGMEVPTICSTPPAPEKMTAPLPTVPLNTASVPPRITASLTSAGGLHDRGAAAADHHAVRDAAARHDLDAAGADRGAGARKNCVPPGRHRMRSPSLLTTAPLAGADDVLPAVRD